MRLDGYENCCGAKILHDFGYSMSANYPTDDLDENPELHDKAHKPTKEQFFEELAHYKSVFCDRGMFTLILDKIQQPIIGPWIEEGGGELVATAGNGGGKYPIYLYVIVLNELKEQK